ncbi:hypothetical protein BEP19_02220 [Ammoniphilus oxalaticus]|uniref:Uncharacterized protein n=1 Tax=Ammoniphilus oxalaticus TaxID=66863 RepID=A0A419SND3_9BACL|nr:hypothetical protein [Ammoniphilus oxalaticus]RKD25777.1 hypothetical protein BEP19_02220 [Ammoniphilus oxalaticus]
MGVLLFIAGFIGILVSSILLFVDLINKRRLRYKVVSLALSFGLIGLAYLNFSVENPKETKAQPTVTELEPETLPWASDEEPDEETLALQKELRKVIHDAFGSWNGFNGRDTILQLDYNSERKSAFIRVFGKDGLTTNLIKRTIWQDAHDVLKKVKLMNGVEAVDFQIVLPLKADNGDIAHEIVMKMTFSAKAFAAIDWGDFPFEKMPQAADVYWVHRALD